MDRLISSASKTTLISLSLFCLLASLTFASVSAVVSPQSAIYADSNQTFINVSAIPSGGTYVQGQSSTYYYQVSVAPGTSCPGYSLPYGHPTVNTNTNRAWFYYLPGGTTSDCKFVWSIGDYAGHGTNITTGQIIVSLGLVRFLYPTASSAQIYQGQTSVITISPPTGGTLPIRYQWFATTAGGSAFSSAMANTICGESATTQNCTFITNSTTSTGVYSFKVNSTDSAYKATYEPSAQTQVTVIKATTTTTVLISATTSVLQSTTIPTTTIQEIETKQRNSNYEIIAIVAIVLIILAAIAMYLRGKKGGKMPLETPFEQSDADSEIAKPR